MAVREDPPFRMKTGPKSLTPDVSIGMPVYNGERFLERAIASLLAQTYIDFELIISDNGSTDQTSALCVKYAGLDARIKYIRHPENKGGRENLLFVLQKASGEYFMWAASDDEWDKDFIKTLYEGITAGKNRVAAFCPYRFIDEAGSPIGPVRSFDYSGSRLIRLYKFIWHYDDGFTYGLYKRDVVKDTVFPAWWGINAKTNNKNAYPMLFRVLASGDFAWGGASPLWFNRLHDYRQYQPGLDTRNLLLKYYAFCLKEVNILYESLRSIYAGSRSFLLVFLCLPGLVLRCLYDCGPFVLKKLFMNAIKII